MPYLPEPESPTQRLRALLAERLRRVEEHRFARRACGRALRSLARVRATLPGLRDEQLHEAVLAHWNPIEGVPARALLRQVRGSLLEWGSGREPRLIDVVRYVIVRDYLRQEEATAGMSIDLGRFLARRIDPRL